MILSPHSAFFNLASRVSAETKPYLSTAKASVMPCHSTLSQLCKLKAFIANSRTWGFAHTRSGWCPQSMILLPP